MGQTTYVDNNVNNYSYCRMASIQELFKKKRYKSSLISETSVAQKQQIKKPHLVRFYKIVNY